MYVYLYPCMHVYMYICIYVYMYTCMILFTLFSRETKTPRASTLGVLGRYFMFGYLDPC